MMKCYEIRRALWYQRWQWQWKKGTREKESGKMKHALSLSGLLFKQDEYDSLTSKPLGHITKTVGNRQISAMVYFQSIFLMEW